MIARTDIPLVVGGSFRIASFSSIAIRDAAGWVCPQGCRRPRRHATQPKSLGESKRRRAPSLSAARRYNGRAGPSTDAVVDPLLNAGWHRGVDPHGPVSRNSDGARLAAGGLALAVTAPYLPWRNVVRPK